jgi:serine/threonine protein kinase
LHFAQRDIKPSNIMCRTGSDLNEFGANCVLGDFSSAFDEFSSQHFYSKGPSAAEQTNEYAPPEALFAKEWIPFYKAKPESYDSWSIGVLILELLLGTPNVFSVDQRTTTLLTNKMNKEGASEEDIQRALYLAALSQFCIYVPTNESDKNWPLREGDPLFKASIVKTTCTIHDFQNALRARDPLGIGFDKSIDPLLQL